MSYKKYLVQGKPLKRCKIVKERWEEGRGKEGVIKGGRKGRVDHRILSKLKVTRPIYKNQYYVYMGEA
jgi:hypothetical protein